MTQRENYRLHHTVRDAMKAYTYTPGSPADPEEARMINRLADKVQALAAVYDEPMTRVEALARAQENLRFVKALAGAKRVAG